MNRHDEASKEEPLEIALTFEIHIVAIVGANSHKDNSDWQTPYQCGLRGGKVMLVGVDPPNTPKKVRYT